MKKIAIIGSSSLSDRLIHYFESTGFAEVTGMFDDFETSGTIKYSKQILGKIEETVSIYKKGTFDAIVIGIAQVLALVPGSSRSGTTISAGLFLGLARDAAARFSFLLSVPAVFASGLYEMYKIHQLMKAGTDVFTLGIGNLVVATIVSGVAGYAAIAWLLRYLMKNTTLVFVWYRFALGFVLVLLLLTGSIFP